MVDRRRTLRLTTGVLAGGLAGATAYSGPAAAKRDQSEELRFTGKLVSLLPEQIGVDIAYHGDFELDDSAGVGHGFGFPIALRDGAGDSPPGLPDPSLMVEVVGTVVWHLNGGFVTTTGSFRRPAVPLLATFPWEYTLAITGGGGEYRGAAGTTTLRFLSKEHDFELTISLAA